MGHKSGRAKRPRHGSLQYWPRKRAKRIYPRVSYPECEELKILGFAGYKAGMSHGIFVDNRKTSPTKGEQIFIPFTVLEVPPLRVFGVRFYGSSPYGFYTIGEVISEKLDKELERKICVGKKKKKKEEKKRKTFEDYEKVIDEIADIRLIVHTQPKLIKLKKKPEIFEIAIGGKDIKEKFEYAKSLLGKEIKITDVFKEGEQVDVVAVTKGKGTQGSVKRFGVKILPPKTEKIRRKAGVLSPTTPKKTPFTALQFGQLGFHTRTEFNKWILKIGEDGKEITPKGGFVNYGIVRGSYILLKGSIPGPKKRLICLRKAKRPRRNIPPQPPQLIEISAKSQQG